MYNNVQTTIEYVEQEMDFCEVGASAFELGKHTPYSEHLKAEHNPLSTLSALQPRGIDRARIREDVL